ncbi:MAG: helix-turn-helix transcriptional regulator [Clostridia bacterium]|nr:helix-turn-helix transcriptional regulator [Clostridia bacterium]
MEISEKIKQIRNKEGLTQEQFSEKINVSRNAVAKWETNRGYPDIQNLISISEVFYISLDELVKDDVNVKNKIIAESSSKKWHILVILYLVAIIIYIVYFLIFHKIFMIGFLISTIFMLGIETYIFIKDKIWKNKN